MCVGTRDTEERGHRAYFWRAAPLFYSIMSKKQKVDADDSSLGASDKKAFHVTDDFCFDLEHFSIPEHYAPDLDSVMIVSTVR